MDIDNALIYLVCALAVFLLFLLYFLTRNIHFRKKAEMELLEKNEEITSVYEELAAYDEELKENYYQLMEKQEELQRSEQRYRIVAESTMDIIWEGDLINKRRLFSEKVYDILGYRASELEALDAWFDIVHPEDIDWVKRDIKLQIEEKIDVKAFEYRVKCKDGSFKWIRSNTRCEFDESGSAVAVFGAFTDITELKNQEEKIRKLAYYDSVTGLPNRAMLSELAADEIERCIRINRKFALIFIDLDNFKFVNDCYGHLTGDKLLFEVGKRLQCFQDENIMAFRLGGDEFIVLIKDPTSREQVKEISLALYNALAEAIFVDNNMFRTDFSSGIVLYPEDGNSFNELLKNADTAMYRSKESGKNSYTFYERSMCNTAIERIKMKTDILRALKNNEFVLFFQPIFDVEHGNIRGVEALIRWMHPEKGIIYPDRFIGMAEESGLIIEIGKWVIRDACEYAKSMYDRGVSNFYISINVSTVQLMQKDFTDYVLNTVGNIGLPPELLSIEIMESALMESKDLVIKRLKELKENKIKIALDDFGCRYSSLKYLKMLPINIVKIDKSLIDDIESQEDEKSMAGIIISMLKQLGLSAVGKGVEDREQLSYLERHGCDMFQGYLASRPISKEEMDNLIYEL